MKQETIFKKLGAILSELNEQYQFLAQNPEQLNELELELFHANADFLADHIQIIKKLNNNKAPLTLPAADEDFNVPAQNTYIKESTVDVVQDEMVLDNFSANPITEETTTTSNEELQEEVVFVNDNISPKIVVDEPELEIEEPIKEEKPDLEREIFKLDNEETPSFEFILNSHQETDNFDFEEKTIDEIFDRPLSEEEQHILAQKQKLKERAQQSTSATQDEEDEIGPEPFLVHHEEEALSQVQPIFEEDLTLSAVPEPVAPVAEEVVEDPNYKPTLNDILAGKNSSTNLNTNTSAGVKDLKQAISLNDKLLYIKDLFNGYNLAYAEAIDLANKLPNFETADNFFKKNYAVKYNWADKQTTVDKFYKLLNERFRA